MTSNLHEALIACETAFERKDWGTFVSHARHLIRIIDDAAIVDRLRFNLVAALQLNPQRTSSDLEEARSICTEQANAAATGTAEWSILQRRLGYLCASIASLDSNSDRASLLRQAVAHYESALTGDIPDHSLRATINTQIAYALLQSEAMSESDRARARSHLLQAQSFFNAEEYPEENSEVSRCLQAISNSSDRNPAVSSLLEAATNGWILRVADLILNGVDLEAHDDDGCTALQLAVSEGHREVAIRLIASGAKVDVRDKRGFTVLHWAVFSNDPVLLALAYSEPVGLDPQDSEGRTPLSWAASEDWSASVKWLVDHGANVELSDSDGWTPLHHACGAGREHAVRLLVAGSARLSSLSLVGESPLAVARRLGHVNVVGILERRN